MSSSSPLENFYLGKTLHEGIFSTVQVIKERDNQSGRIFTLKSVDKSYYAIHKLESLLEAETELRSQNASQWIVGLQSCFEDDNKKMHFIMEYLPGGNFIELLKSNGGRMEEQMAMFYMGELVLAINAVHCLGFAHRNVKPANILLDGNGHIKLSGFGSASKIKDGKVSSPLTVNSASYEAPEILRTLGNENFSYGVECDWWSLGVIAYETITGVHPFEESSAILVFRKITSKKTRGSVKIPARSSQDCKDFISGLLLEQEDRMTYNDCICHPFFNELIWDGLRNEIAPLKPNLHLDDIGELGGGKMFNVNDCDNSVAALDDDQIQMLSDMTCPPTMANNNLTFVYTNKSKSKLVDITEEKENTTTTSERGKVNSSHWSVAEMMGESKLDSKTKKKNNSSADLTRLLKEENEKLQSELNIKTEQLMGKLNEIQILQTQLHKSSESMESFEKQVAICTKENQRLKAELEKKSGELANEKYVRVGLENKLSNINFAAKQKASAIMAPRPPSTPGTPSSRCGGDTSIHSTEVFELKEQIANLMASDGQKDDMILDLNVALLVTRHELSVQKMENICMYKRDTGGCNMFVEDYKQIIADFQPIVTQLMADIRTQHKEETGSEEVKSGTILPENEDQGQTQVNKWDESSYEQFLQLPQQIEKMHNDHASLLEKVVNDRKKIAEFLGSVQLQVDTWTMFKKNNS
ncbi:citron Rho-interacting kinase [Folsomia candida]|uniref:citron Rho-interacting kinase n=1 Tax=Folsomia candida TaxID=158441 RepID=UPI000B8EFBC8|nr:citron Rho-interacting kinase [Folsomia candida]